MKVPERTGKWIELARSSDSDDEITMQVPNGMWAGWMMPVHLKEKDLAEFLRSIGWHVDLPQSAAIPRTVVEAPKLNGHAGLPS